VFGSISANGGGGGGGGSVSGANGNGRTGGSGGGAGRSSTLARTGGTSVKTAGGLGNAGGDTAATTDFSAAGGGGSAGVGSDGSLSGTTPRPGGAGTTNSIRTGSAVTYAAGGTGGARSGTYTPGAGTTNRGDGGDGAPGGSGVLVNGAAGSAGIVVISYNNALYPEPTYVTGIYGQAISFNNTLSPADSDPNCYVIYDVSSFGLSSNSGAMSLWLESGLTYPITSGCNPYYINLQGETYYSLQTENNASYRSNISFHTGLVGGNFASTPAPTGWNHYCYVFSNVGATGASNTISYAYLNGTLLGSSNNYSQNFTELRLACQTSQGNGALCSIDDVRLFNTPLTATQVQSIYAALGVPGRGAIQATHLLSLIPSSPVFIQTFGTSSVPTSDLYGATLTSSGSPTMYLDATRGYVFPATGTTYMTSNFNLPVSYSKTIWVYHTGAPGTGNLLSSESAIAGSHYFWFNNSNFLNAGHSSGTAVVNYVSDPVTLTLNQWMHYVVTYDQTTTTMKLYKNAIQVASTTNAAMSWTGGSAVGICQFNGGNTLTNGRVDNPIIYNRALTAPEVSLLYTTQFNNPTLGETTAGLTYNPISLTGTPLFSQLSQAATSSAVGAFSLRAVNGTSARAVQVRRSSDSATQDFYADRLGNLLTAPVTGQPLANWLGGATGYVTTWYDQSGAGNHASQATAANQPIIQKATKGPGYMCLFNGTTNYLTGMSYTVLNATNFSFNVVERRTGSTSGGTVTNDLTLVSCGDVGATGKLLYLTYRYDTNSLFGSWSPELFSTITAFTSASTEPIRYTSATASSTSGRRVYIYNDPLGNPITTTNATQTSLMSMTSGNFQIGYYNFGSSTSYYKGEIYEVLVFTQSLYDLDNTGGLITQVYQNQLGYTGT
jgi:hypothetical protein